MYAYCLNNPVRGSDPTGKWFGEDAWDWTKQAATDAGNWISINWKTCVDWAAGIAGTGSSVVGTCATIGVFSIPVVGQVALGVVGVVCGVWGIGRLAKFW